jgi:hypothetical protein
VLLLSQKAFAIRQVAVARLGEIPQQVAPHYRLRHDKVTVLADDRDIRVLDRDTGILIRKLGRTRDHQPRGVKCGKQHRQPPSVPSQDAQRPYARRNRLAERQSQRHRDGPHQHSQAGVAQHRNEFLSTESLSYRPDRNRNLAAAPHLRTRRQGGRSPAPRRPHQLNQPEHRLTR